MSHHHTDDEVHEHDLGLQHDLGTLRSRGLRPTGLGRRGVLGIIGGLGAAAVAGCAVGSDTETDTGASAASVADGEIPEETTGPFPGDGSNGPNVLSESGIVRSDITTSFGSASGVAEGVPLTVRFRVYDLSGEDVSPMAGAALYAWHCDRGGAYSMYDGDAASENYLRGVQAADDDGWLEFTTIFPGAYAGRWPHIHFEVYESLDSATSASTKLRTSQLALPQDVCEQVYAEAGYEESVGNLAATSLATDGIFSDGYSLQMATVTGSVADGLVATLNVPI